MRGGAAEAHEAKGEAVGAGLRERGRGYRIEGRGSLCEELARVSGFRQDPPEAEATRSVRSRLARST